MREMHVSHCRLHNGTHSFDTGQLTGRCTNSDVGSRWVFQKWFDRDRIATVKHNLMQSRLLAKVSCIWTDGLLWDILYYQAYAPRNNTIAKALYADPSASNPMWNAVVHNYEVNVARYLQELKRHAMGVPIVWFTTHRIPRPTCEKDAAPRDVKDALTRLQAHESRSSPRLCRTFFIPEIIERMNQASVRSAQTAGVRVFDVQERVLSGERHYLKPDGFHLQPRFSGRAFEAALALKLS